MAVPNRGARDRYQARLERRLQNVDDDLFARLLARCSKHVADGGVLVKRDEQQRGLSEPRKLPGLCGEGPLQPIGQRNASQCALASVDALQPQSTWKLEQRQWVAQCLVQNQAAGLDVQVWCDGYQQIRRRRVAQRFDMDLLQQRGLQRGLERLSHADDEEDVRRLEPPSDKAQDGGGRTVQPLKVVRNHDQRTFAGDLVEEAQRCQADKKHFGRRPRPHSQCGEQRVFLGTRKRADRSQDGLQKLVQPRVRKISLAFETCDRKNLVAAAAGGGGGRVQQRRFADAGCSSDEQRAAVLRRLGESLVEQS